MATQYKVIALAVLICAIAAPQIKEHGVDLQARKTL